MKWRDWLRRQPFDLPPQAKALLTDEDDDRPAGVSLFAQPVQTARGVEGIALSPAAILGQAVANPWEGVAVQRIAQACASGRLVWRDGGPRGTVIERDPWLDRLRSPQPDLSEYDLWEETFSWFEWAGNSFWALDEVKGEAVPWIEVLPPTQMAVLPGTGRRFGGYIQKVNNQEIAWKPDEIVHFRGFNPFSQILGMPIQAPLSKTLETYDKATDYNLAFFENGGAISGIIETKEVLQEGDFHKMRRQLHEEYSGAVNAHKWMVLDNGMQYKPVGYSQQDADYHQGRRFDRETILSGHGVPPTVAGITDSANYNTAVAEQQFFFATTVYYRQIKVARTLERVMRRLAGKPRLWCGFDNGDLPVLQADPRMEMIRLTMAIRWSVLSPNEARAELGYGPVDGGDELLVPGSTVTLDDLDAMIADPAPNPETVTEMLRSAGRQSLGHEKVFNSTQSRPHRTL